MRLAYQALFADQADLMQFVILDLMHRTSYILLPTVTR